MNNSIWPTQELEYVHNCPLCGSIKFKEAITDVKDWTFHTSASFWTYHECDNCFSLFLNPRPKKLHIHKSYVNYYTHANKSSRWYTKMISIIKNEIYSQLYSRKFSPRIGFPFIFAPLFTKLASFYQVPFGLDLLVRSSPGSCLDVGCGDGNVLNYAKQLGWEVHGIEFDDSAASIARAKGLNVVTGDYNILVHYDKKYDLVICCHVIEHIYEPLLLINLLVKSLNENGLLLLAFPNAKSWIRQIFGKYWRGLEAPRHIVIPSDVHIENILKGKFKSVEKVNYFSNTLRESKSIYENVELQKFKCVRSVNQHLQYELNDDLVGFICSEKY